MGGHGLMNFAARHVKLFTLNVVIVLEPAIGIVIGGMLFGATVSLLQAFGGAILAVAVIIGLRQEAQP
jgi:drug/metabolite transporter (DMT)-like permease